MPRKSNSDESSIATLAGEFMRKFRRAGPEGRLSEQKTVVDEPEKRKAKAPSPVTASVLSLFLWGSGFLYLRRPFLASLVLFLLLASATLFGALTGILPDWMSTPLLRDIGWRHPLGPSLILSGAVLSIVWWLSIVVPTAIARRAPTARAHRLHNPVVILGVSFLPMAGHFSQQRFWVGCCTGIFYFWVPLSAAAIFKCWEDSAVQPLAEVARMEPLFLLLAILFGLSFVVALWAFGNSLIGAMDEIGWLKTRREGGATEWKFVILGSILVIGTLFYGVAGPPGDRARQKLQEFSTTVETRGFHLLGRIIQQVVHEWADLAAPIRDRF